MAGRFKISDSLKADLILGLQNLSTNEPPDKDFQIIFLRNNLLTYYEGAAMESAFRTVVESLIPDGFLIVGSHEKIPPNVRELSPSGFSRLVFRKKHRSEP